MKRTVWAILAMAAMAGTGLASAPTGGEKQVPTLDEMERYERGLELKAHEAKLLHEQEMRKLDLEQRRAEIARVGDRSRGGPQRDLLGMVLLLSIVAHILLTVWVYRDMREKGIGRALWVPIVLLTGICGAILYAIVRLADTRSKPVPPEGKAKQAA